MGNLWNLGEEKSIDPVWAATAWLMTSGRSWGRSARMAAEHMPGALVEFLKARANMLQDNQPMARSDHLVRTIRDLQAAGQDVQGGKPLFSTCVSAAETEVREEILHLSSVAGWQKRMEVRRNDSKKAAGGNHP